MKEFEIFYNSNGSLISRVNPNLVFCGENNSVVITVNFPEDVSDWEKFAYVTKAESIDVFPLGSNNPSVFEVPSDCLLEGNCMIGFEVRDGDTVERFEPIEFFVSGFVNEKVNIEGKGRNINFSDLFGGLNFDGSNNILTAKSKSGVQIGSEICLGDVFATNKIIPSKTSDLVNDSGFLTQHQDVSGKMDKIANGTENAIPKQDANGNLVDSMINIDDVALKSDVEELYRRVFGGEPKTWKDVQDIVRAGKAEEFFNIGDQFVVEKLSNATASKGTSTGISDVTVVATSFVKGMGETHAGAYIFIYDGNSWCNDNSEVVNLEDYGITVIGTPDVGDNVTIIETTSQLKFDIIGINHDTPANSNYTHSMTLQLHDELTAELIYDSPEAAFYIDGDIYPNGLVAGTYNFTWDYETGSMVNGTYQFTLSEDVPVGGQIVIGTNSSSMALTSCKIRTYATSGSNTAIESDIAITVGSEGASLGTITSKVVTSSINCAQRIMWGSNSWKSSGIRQWLNTDSDANAWWEAKNIFDRPTNADKAGFLKNMDAAFLDIIGEVIKKTQKSTSDGYGLEDTTEKFFLLSKPEVYAGTEYPHDGADGKVYAYYSAERSDMMTESSTYNDTNRVKYRGGSAQYWWLRTPYSDHSHIVRVVSPSGSVSSNYAFVRYDVAPACVIV